jgi:hypothetical protein
MERPSKRQRLSASKFISVSKELEKAIHTLTTVCSVFVDTKHTRTATLKPEQTNYTVSGHCSWTSKNTIELYTMLLRCTVQLHRQKARSSISCPCSYKIYNTRRGTIYVRSRTAKLTGRNELQLILTIQSKRIRFPRLEHSGRFS